MNRSAHNLASTSRPCTTQCAFGSSGTFRQGRMAGQARPSSTHQLAVGAPPSRLRLACVTLPAGTVGVAPFVFRRAHPEQRCRVRTFHSCAGRRQAVGAEHRGRVGGGGARWMQIGQRACAVDRLASCNLGQRSRAPCQLYAARCAHAVNAVRSGATAAREIVRHTSQPPRTAVRSVHPRPPPRCSWRCAFAARQRPQGARATRHPADLACPCHR
jgi:hypothetical protein